MPHRQKNKHRARHRIHDVKPASLPKPLLPMLQTSAPETSTQTEQVAVLPATLTSPLDDTVSADPL